MATQRQKDVKAYADAFYDLLKEGKIPRAEIKRMLYDDKKNQEILEIEEAQVDGIWESLMEGTFSRNHPTRIGGYKKHIITEEGKMPKTNRGKRITHYDPKTQEIVKIYENTDEASQALGISDQKVRYLCTATPKKPKLILRFEGAPFVLPVAKEKQSSTKKEAAEKKDPSVREDTAALNPPQQTTPALEEEIQNQRSIETARYDYLNALAKEALRGINDLEKRMLETEKQIIRK